MASLIRVAPLLLLVCASCAASARGFTAQSAAGTASLRTTAPAPVPVLGASLAPRSVAPYAPPPQQSGLYVSELNAELADAPVADRMESELREQLMDFRADSPSGCSTAIILDLSANMTSAESSAVMKLRWIVSTPEGQVLALWQQSVAMSSDPEEGDAWRRGLVAAADSVRRLLRESAAEILERAEACYRPVAFRLFDGGQ